MQTVTDLPKRWNWTRKADISRISSRPALCSWCHLICRYLRSKRYCYCYLFVFGKSFPQLDMNHVMMMPSCTATSKHAHKAAQAWPLLHAALHRPSIRVCASCWCTQPGHQGRPGPHEGHSRLVQRVISPFGGWNGDNKGTGMLESQPNYVTINVGGRCGTGVEIGHLLAVLCHFRVYIINLKCSVCRRHLEPWTWAIHF